MKELYQILALLFSLSFIVLFVYIAHSESSKETKLLAFLIFLGVSALTYNIDANNEKH